MQTPKIDIVITQHQTLVELLRERGLIDSDTPVLAHARPEDVRGRHVLGVIPHHLSSLAASITEIPIRFDGADERRAFAGGDIPMGRLREIAGEPVHYTVNRINGGGIDRARPRWLAVARAYEHVERHGYHFGSGPGSLLYVDRHWRGLRVTVIGETTEQHSAEVIESRGVWRPECRGPWLDGYGREVADDDIEPASGAGRKEAFETGQPSTSPSNDFDTWLGAWWPEWQRRHGRGVSATIDPDERAALREAYEAGSR